MKRDLPGCTFIIGCLLESATVEFKQHFASSLGQSSLLIWSFSAVACALFGLGLAWSLRNIFRGSHPRPAFAYVCLNLLAVAVLYGIHIAEYVVLSRLEQMPRPNSILPTLIDKAQGADSESKRKTMAQQAFEYCGVRIMYRRDDGGEIQHAPKAADQKLWNDRQKTERLSDRTTAIMEGQLRQLPFIMTLNAGCFLLSFAVTIWALAFCERRDQLPNV